jgi:HEAT repeats
MTRTVWSWALLSAWVLGLAARADEVPADQRKAIDRGLEWIAQAQSADGHWDAAGGPHSTTLTARAAMALLMEGSTTRQGKYCEHIRRAVDWLVERSQNNGLLADPNDPAQARDYMEGHGCAMLFLASVYGREENDGRGKKLEKVLTRAVDFCGQAQLHTGGWSYVSAKDAGGHDVGDLTVTQMQGLRACLNAGIAGPRPILDKALKYLEKCTTLGGGVIFSLASGTSGGERPNLTAAALVSSFSAGQYDSDLVKKWLQFCRSTITLDPRFDPDGSGRYYYAQALHLLGDTGFERLFPNSSANEQLTWSKYKKLMFNQLIGTQGQDGSWTGRNDRVLLTTMNLTILQLDSTNLPIYRRTALKEEAPGFIKNLGDRDARVRLEAAEGLARVGALKSSNAREGVGPLCAVALGDRDARVRAAATASLGELRLEPARVVPVLCKLVKEDKDRAVQLAAINALGSFGPAAKDARPVLLHAEAETLEELEKTAADYRTEKITESKYQSIKAALGRIGK